MEELFSEEPVTPDKNGSELQIGETNSDEKIPQRLLSDEMEITVTEAEKRANGTLNIRDYFTVYLIETRIVPGGSWTEAAQNTSLWRRYSQFELLRAYLENAYPYIITPCLPEKKALYSWSKAPSDTFDPDFVDRRRAGLETFLLRLASHPVLCKDPVYLGFLQQNEGWQETLKDFGYMQVAESKLKALSLPVRLRNPDKRFESIKNYGAELQCHLGGMLKIRARMLERLHSLYKLHANYGRVFSEWSAIENEMGDGLQRTGHYMDSLAASVDATLEEEELVADQLKEYLFLANALQMVCRRQQGMQLTLERAQGSVEAKNSEKQKLQQGKSGLMARLFGTVDNEEVREARLGQLEQRISQGCGSLKTAQSDVSTFSTLALQDIERFQQQKVKDLRETLKNYVMLQVKSNRKSLAVWTHIRDCLQSIP